MNSANYTLQYNNDDKKPIKTILLGFCILLDLIVLAGIIACFSTKKYLDLIIYAAIFIFALAIRISSLFFTFEVTITLRDGKLYIIKKYPIREIKLFEEEKSQINVENWDKSKRCDGKKYVRLCSKSCEENVYVIELSGRKYLIYLDNYLFSLIEVRRDLS